MSRYEAWSRFAIRRACIRGSRLSLASRIPPSCTAEALERFTSVAFAVGVRLEPDDRWHIDDPFGLADLFAMRQRRNP
jgi:hypothetical protein